MSVVSLPVPSPHLVVFGRDQSGKPHASWFDQASAELATKAAALMNMRAVPVEDEALRELASSLPRGRVFSSGKAFTPFVKGKLYERLIELTRDLLGLLPENTAANENQSEAQGGQGGEDVGKQGAENAPQPGPVAAAIPPAQGQPRPTQANDIGMGSLVLAEDRTDGGWFEAEVIGVNGAMLTLKWRDYAAPTVVRRATELGFLPVLSA